MQRKLLATVAAAPLLALATASTAEVTITTATTTPVTTATAAASGPDNIRITSAGSLKPTAAGPAVTVNSNNTFTNEGTISTEDVSDSIGVLVLGGFSGGVTNTATISLTDTFTPTDTDGDGDVDGAFATGQNRYGIRVTGPGAFTGTIANNAGGAITVDGADSRGISIETTLAGQLVNGGAITMTGERVYGIRSTAAIGGGLTMTGTVSTQGRDAVGVAMDGDVGGQVRVQGSILTYGYRYLDRPFLATDRAKLDADDLYQSGSALRIAGNVGGGLLLDGPPADLIADDGKDDTTADSDEDNDGVADSAEGSAAITVYGGAPAVMIGSDTRSVTLGVTGQSSQLNWGIVNKGAITASGVYDGVATTGMQIGGSTGQATVITNGMNNAGSIEASSFEANATGLRLTAGAQVSTLTGGGSISAFTTSEGAVAARGLLIEQGASMTNLIVGGGITAGVSGEKGSATAIEDRSGTLRSIQNTGRIIAAITPTDDADDKDDADNDATNEVVTGRAIAIDVRAASGGVTILQQGVTDGDDGKDGIADPDADGDGVDDLDEPGIVGDILFGAKDDSLFVSNGTVNGAIAFGAGQDRLELDGTARVIGDITDSDGKLGVRLLGASSLTFTNAQTVNITSLDVAGGASLLFTADPAAGTATKLVANTVTLQNGAKLGLTLKSLLDTPTRYTVIEAATLNAGTLSQDLFGSTPYLITAQALADRAAGKVYIDVRARTAAELGFSTSQSAAYSAVLAAVRGDAGVQEAVLAQTTRAGLVDLYDQLTPDTGEGTFASLQTANQLMAQATGNRPDPYDRYGPDSFWAQEINTLVRREDGDTQGSDSQVFGFIGGYESMSANGGALGATLAYVNVEEHDSAAVVGENTTASVLQGGVYYRKSMGGFLFNAGAGGGYGWFDGTRRFIAGDMDADGAADVIRTNNADWRGATANAFLGLGYQAMVGRFYARPEARFDYLWLREGERKETGGGKALDMTIEERTNSNLSGEAAIVFGANFGRDVWFRPEVRVGYRQSLAGELGDTIAQFAGGTPFTTVASAQDDGAMTLNIALRSGTPMSYVAIEAGAEARKKQKRYNVRLSGRVMF